MELESAKAKYQYLLKHSNALHKDEKPQECPYCKLIAKEDYILKEKTAKLDAYWEVLLKANEPQLLEEEPLKQLGELSRYTYEDIDGSIKALIGPEEMMQLTVHKGNLTPDERLAMEAHVTHSYEFLKRIPWTGKLKQIPEIAYGHHEKLDGTGYPRGLKQEEIPVQTQMMVIADIYDALTAGDRPYKEGLPTEKALKILRAEAAGHKINGELLELFEERQVFSVLGHSLGGVKS